ncbi:MAG: sigma-70 family RNA polymerase sigma factor [bacterium]
MSDIARLEDAVQVAGARLGDRAAWDSLVRRRGPRLYAHARRLTDSAEAAQDVVQDAWIEVMRGLGGLRDDHAFLPWALRIVTRRAARVIRGQVADRRLAREFAVEQVLVPEAAETALPEQALTRAIGQLPRDQAAALALFYLEDMRVAEVAVALDIPPGTVKTRLMLARLKLRVIMQGVDHG